MREGGISGRPALALPALLLAAVLFGTWAAGTAQAQTAPSPDLPVLITADEVGYDQKNGIVTARGNVEISQDDRVLRADSLTYNQRTRIVIASGNVSLTEPTGEVMFADRVEITDDLKDGVVTNFRLLFPDETRIAANDARREGGVRTEMNQVVFSPCKKCEDEDADEPPLWQIKARKVVHDQESHDIEYYDAVLEMFGVPVAYTPYLTHPDPTVKRRSGFLVPSYGNDSQLGIILKTPYFIVLGPDKDLTVEPIFTSKERAGLAAEYRQRIVDGKFKVDGSFTRVHRRGANGERAGGEQNRGHVFGDGQFDIDQTWRWGFDAGWTTDDTYLRRYGISSTDVIASTAFVEGFSDRNYTAVRGYHFQGLRLEDDYDQTPIVAPLIDYNMIGEPLGDWGRWSLDANIMTLTRAAGTGSRRLSAKGGWEMPVYGPIGDLFTLSAGVQADLYWVNAVNENPRVTGGPKFTGVIGRIFPHLMLDWRYPLVREVGNVRQLVEPRAALLLAPNANNPNEIPNEDSQDFEFDDTNLFEPNRFPGLDRVSGGQWLAYGLGTGFYGDKGGKTTAFVGQTYRLIGTDDTFGINSGLDKQMSDVVGRVTVEPADFLKLAYRFRLDPRDFSARRHEVASVFGPRVLKFSANYLFFDNTASTSEFGNREEILASVRAQITDRWSVGGRWRHDLTRNGGVLSNGVNITYVCDCLTATVDLSRSFTRDRDIKATTRLFIQLVFKHLGSAGGALN